MQNEHVYLYYRWRHWMSVQTHRLFAATLYAQWAQDERTKQCNTKSAQPAPPPHAS